MILDVVPVSSERWWWFPSDRSGCDDDDDGDENGSRPCNRNKRLCLPVSDAPPNHPSSLLRGFVCLPGGTGTGTGRVRGRCAVPAAGSGEVDVREAAAADDDNGITDLLGILLSSPRLLSYPPCCRCW